VVELKTAVASLDASGIQLPHDHKTMSALYTEATFHGITELQQALTDHSFWARVKSLFGIVRKSSGVTTNIHPFNAVAATKAFTLLRASLLALGGVVGTVTVTKASSKSSSSDDSDSMVTRMVHWMGLLYGGDEEAEEEEEEEEEAGEEGDGEAQAGLV
jgi:hypothetical protein